jgi:hypothetical protein
MKSTRKIDLNLSDLHVDSFPIEGEDAEAGTVKGQGISDTAYCTVDACSDLQHTCGEYTCNDPYQPGPTCIQDGQTCGEKCW